MIDLKQKELKAWQDRNFDNKDLEAMSKPDLIALIHKLQMALGIVEEAGEIAHHVLKGSQHIRGGLKGIDKEQVADGVADNLIFGMQLLSSLDVDAEKEIEKVIDCVLQRDWKTDPA